ncbi:MAG: hypothetical protein ACR2QU_01765 [Gammaproteobacteria bacterium]
MHATTKQLLEVRDGETVANDVRAHIDFCDICQGELARLAGVRDELRDLPQIKPDKGLWQAVAVESLGRPAPQRFSWASAAGIAASFVVALILVTRLSSGPGNLNDGGPEAVAGSDDKPLASAPAATVAEVVPPVAAASSDALRTRSRRLESLRRAMPQRPQVMRASTTRTIVDLEDRIALVDMRLNASARLGLTPQQEKALWRERVNLMNTLVRLEYSQISSPRY